MTEEPVSDFLFNLRIAAYHPERGIAEGEEMNGGKKATKRADKRTAGVAAVEFALVLPLLLVILFGIIDFGLMLYDKAMITNAAREGARAGIVLRSPRLTKAEIEGVASSYCAAMLIRLAGSGECAATATVPASGGAFGEPLQVSVAYQYDGPIMSLVKLLPGGSSLTGPLNLVSTAVMKYE